MSTLKPLIFIHPLSDTLKKLQEVIQESAEAEGIELYEIDDIGEFNQLFPSIGQSVAIFADPKKCAKALQANKKTIQKVHSKVILLSSKPIPKKTLEKFDKVGLTESIIEPVIPKTLLYKVKLHLRSIVSKSEQEEETKHFSKNDEKNNLDENNDQSKTFTKDSSKTEEEQLDYLKRESKKKDADDEDKSENSYHDEEIDKHWKGKNTVIDDSVWDDEKKEKSNFHEESIDGYYKGKVRKNGLTLEEEEETKKESEDFLDNEIDDIKKSLMLEVEDDIKETKKKKNESSLSEEENTKKKKSNVQLATEETAQKEPKNSQEAIDSYMRGKNSLTKNEQNQNQAQESTRDHLKDESMRGEITDLYHDDLNEKSISENSSSLDIDIEEEKTKKRELGEKLEGAMTHDGQVINPEDTGPLVDIKKRKTENIEKYIKGSLSHLKDDEEPEMIDNETDFLIEPAQKEKNAHKNRPLEEEMIDNDDLGSLTLEIEPDATSQTRSLNPIQEEDALRKNASKKQDKLQKDDHSRDSGVDKIKDQEASESEYSEGDLNDQYVHKSDNPQADVVGEGHLSGEGQISDETEKEKHKADNRADKIQKYYKGKGNSHQEQGWGNIHKPAESNLEEFESPKEEEAVALEEQWEQAGTELQYGSDKKKQSAGEFVKNEKEKGNSGELIYAESDLGEQTIDYKKLKEEFDAIPYDLKEKNKYGDYDPIKKTSGYDVSLSGTSVTEAIPFEGGSAQSSKNAISDFNDPFIKDLPPDLLAQKLAEKEREEIEAQLENESPLIEPCPQGLEEVILLSQMYEDPKENFKSRLNFIAQSIFQKHHGRVVFYLRKPQTEFYEEVYISHFDLNGANVDEFQTQSWNSLKEIKFPFWLQMTLPTWSDSSFQDKDCELFFPFTENQVKLGFAIVHFFDGFEPNRTAILEVLLDAARGIFMEPHQGATIQQPEKKKEDQSETSKGFLGKFFKDKAS